MLLRLFVAVVIDVDFAAAVADFLTLFVCHTHTPPFPLSLSLPAGLCFVLIFFALLCPALSCPWLCPALRCSGLLSLLFFICCVVSQEWSPADAAWESNFERRLLQERERKRQLRLEQQLQVCVCFFSCLFCFVFYFQF